MKGDKSREIFATPWVEQNNQSKGQKKTSMFFKHFLFLKIFWRIYIPLIWPYIYKYEAKLVEKNAAAAAQTADQKELEDSWHPQTIFS